MKQFALNEKLPHPHTAHVKSTTIVKKINGDFIAIAAASSRVSTNL